MCEELFFGTENKNTGFVVRKIKVLLRFSRYIFIEMHYSAVWCKKEIKI